jgi:hypothetical protein
LIETGPAGLTDTERYGEVSAEVRETQISAKNGASWGTP